MAHTFGRGLHPPGNKQLTADKPIEIMPAPDVLHVSLAQHIGKPAKPTVEVGDRVLRGQLIAAAEGSVSANIYAPVSGKVTGFERRITPGGRAEHIVIENDRQMDSVDYGALVDPTPAEILQRFELCGLVGMGGAGFPTAVKLKAPRPIDTLIINGAECEPYISCDLRIMLDYTAHFLDGCRLLARAAGLTCAHIGIEDNKQAAIERLNDYIAAHAIDDIVVVPLKTKYPQGAEKQLIYAVTGRKVPAGGLPAAVGVVVSNVHTALSAFYAVYRGYPLCTRVMTVTGGGVQRPTNLWVSIGTLYDEVIAYCGGFKEDERVVKFISGGPMMGIAVSGGECAVTKTTGCLLAMTDGEAFTGAPSPCINCAKCAKVCPMHLMPMYIDGYQRAGDLDAAERYGAKNCIECGCCAYICPAKRTLVQSIRLAKKQLRERDK